MKIIGCDLHAAQQSIAMVDCDTGEITRKTRKHEGDTVREFYGSLAGPAVVGIEATGSMPWFLSLMEEIGIACRVGHPAAVRKAETRRQKHDRRDAELLMQLLIDQRFPTIWMPSSDLRDLRTLLLHRHHWVTMRTRVQNRLQAIALSHGVRRGPTLWSEAGQETLAGLPLLSHAADRRGALLTLYRDLNKEIRRLDARVNACVETRASAQRLMTHPGCRPDHGIGDGCLLRGSDTVFAWEGVGELRRDHSARALERPTSAAGELEQARQSVLALSVVRSRHAGGPLGWPAPSILSAKAPAEGRRESPSRGGP